MARSSIFPGFRFHPTDVELVMYYLKRKLLGKKIIVNAVAEVNIYDFSPWDLPDKSSLSNGDLECGPRSNRATETGFWKATGKDRRVTHKERTVATIKTLVFHLGHTGMGQRTDWVMHEYKMKDEQLADAGVVQDTYVLCKVFEKSGSGPRNGAQYGAPFYEEAWDDDLTSFSGFQAIVGPNTVDCKQKGPAETNMTVSQRTGSLCITEHDSSVVTYCPNENNTNTPNYCNNQLKAPVMAVSVNEPGSFAVGPAETNMTVSQRTGSLCITEHDSSVVTYCPNENNTNTSNYCNNQLKAPVMAVSVNEPGSFAVTYFPVENNTNILNNCNEKLKAPVMTVFVNEPGSSNLSFSPNETCVDKPPLNHDVMLFEDLVSFLGLSPEDLLNGNNENEGADTQDECIYDELDNFINLDDLNGENIMTDGGEYTQDKMREIDDLDAALTKFYAD